MAKRRLNTKQFLLNCVPSLKQEDDWVFEDAVDGGVVSIDDNPPVQKDLRRKWWKVQYQGNTGACVGYAAAYGVLWWHYVKAGLIKAESKTKPSARFIWMANKETDEITSYPTTFIETAGTQTKLALKVAQKYGCVMENMLPMELSGKLSMVSRGAFYSHASRFRLSSFHNLGSDLDRWKRWIAFQGPILTRLGVDRTWDKATQSNGNLDKYYINSVRGGHAVCLVGYTKDRFIVRNSWGSSWGDGGFAYASYDYALEAFTEAYGAVL